MKSIEDLLYPFLKIYNGLPLSIRNIIGSIYRKIPTRYKYGAFYYKYMQRIHFFENAPYVNKVLMQENLLVDQVNNAIDIIPYYKSFSKIKGISGIKNLPIITKDQIVSNITRFTDQSKKNLFLKANTGGSSGTPFSFYIEKGITRPKESAHFNWYWRKYGFSDGDKMLMIRGKALKNNAKYEYQSINNKLVISCYNIEQNDIEDIYMQILKFKPTFIHAYPSALLTFTKELEVYLKKKIIDLNIKAVFLGSEKIYERDELYLKSFYNSTIVNWYGHSECLIHAGRCDMTGDYHFYPFYGYIELVDDIGKTINESGVEGRIIATGFDNTVMPLIRFDTGDLGAYSDSKTCKCGFKGKSLSQIKGRGKDYIYLKDKAKVSLTAFVFGQHHEEFEKIKEMQIIQHEYGEITLKISPLNLFNEKDQILFRNKLVKSVNGKLIVNIEIVDEIEKTHRGKHILIKQYIQE